MRTVGCAAAGLWRMMKLCTPAGRVSQMSMPVMLAAGGCSALNALTKFVQRRPAPSRWISTPSSSFSTQPVRDWSVRAGKQKGENQRPCTIPRLEWRARWTSDFILMHHATSSLPSDLHDFAIFNEERNGAVRRANRACARGPPRRLPRRIQRIRGLSTRATRAFPACKDSLRFRTVQA